MSYWIASRLAADNERTVASKLRLVRDDVLLRAAVDPADRHHDRVEDVEARVTNVCSAITISQATGIGSLARYGPSRARRRRRTPP